jgi:hypothetical protein
VDRRLKLTLDFGKEEGRGNRCLRKDWRRKQIPDLKAKAFFRTTIDLGPGMA